MAIGRMNRFLSLAGRLGGSTRDEYCPPTSWTVVAVTSGVDVDASDDGAAAGAATGARRRFGGMNAGRWDGIAFCFMFVCRIGCRTVAVLGCGGGGASDWVDEEAVVASVCVCRPS